MTRAFDPPRVDVGEVQEGDHREDGTDRRPKTGGIPASRSVGLPLLLVT